MVSVSLALSYNGAKAISHRRQRVVLDGVSSFWSEVSSGVPQGSLLGPLFFVKLITDLPETVLPGNTIALYTIMVTVQASLTLPQIEIYKEQFLSDFFLFIYLLLLLVVVVVVVVVFLQPLTFVSVS